MLLEISHLEKENVALDGVAAQELVDGHLAFLAHTVDPVTSLIKKKRVK